MTVFQTYRSHEIEAVIPELGQLRIQVFRDFPYLYEGTAEYEESYLKRYSSHPSGFCFTVWEDGQLVGATTCISLAAEEPEIQRPFILKGILPDKVCYFGESIVLREFRGKGYGHRFFDEREQFALKNGFSITAFCSVIREINHRSKPENYRSNDLFWEKRGYFPKER